MRADVLIGAALLGVPAVLVGTLGGPALPLPVRLFFGAIVTGTLVLVGHGLGVPQEVALAGPFVAGLAALAWARRSRAEAPPAPPRERWYAAVAALLLLVPAATTALGALNAPVITWDGFEIWFAKTRGVHLWTPLRDMPFPSYPELGSVLWSLPLRWTGLELESVGRMFVPIAFFLWVAALPAALDAATTPFRIAAAIVAGLLAFDPSALMNGYQDALVLVTAGFAALLLARILVRVGTAARDLDFASLAADARGRTELAIAGFLTGAVSLVKLEGTVVSLLLGGTFMCAIGVGPWIRAPSRTARALVPFFLPWLAMALVWPTLVAWNGIAFEVQGGAFSPSAIGRALENLDRWPIIRPYFAAYIASRGAVIAASALASIACVLLAPRLGRALAFLWAVFATHLAFLLLVFLSTKTDLRWHLESAFHRLAFQGVFTYVLAAAMASSASAESLWGAVRDIRERAR